MRFVRALRYGLRSVPSASLCLTLVLAALVMQGSAFVRFSMAHDQQCERRPRRHRTQRRSALECLGPES